MVEIVMNLLKTEKYDDGIRRYVGMYETVTEGNLKGGPEAIYRNPDKLFESLRKIFGEDLEVRVKSEELPPELRSINWFKGRIKVEDPELKGIIENQQQGGHRVIAA